jgi:hypothetical protein
MKISAKLIGITLGSAVIVTGLVAALVVETKTVSVGYTKILEGPARQAAEARQVQIDFKVQVQDWKDILLRGENPEDLAKYTAQFHDQEAKVKSEAWTLSNEVDDPATKQLLNDFLAADDELSVKYQAAYEVFLKQHFDFRAADALVRGQDRGPSDMFNSVVTQLNARVGQVAAAEDDRAFRQTLTILLVVGGLFFVDSLVYCSVLIGVLKRLGRLKAVSDRLAVADIDGLSIDISGNDEIGAIGESMKGVGAAIHELLAVHA